MLPEIIVGLRHLLDVEYLRPALVAHALSRLQLRLDVDEQRILFPRGLRSASLFCEIPLAILVESAL